jgi:hypothetical protein
MQTLNEILLRFNDDGTFKGAHCRYLESYTRGNGAESFELLPPIEISETVLSAVIPNLTAIALQAQSGVIPEPLPPKEDWKALASALIESDFDEWLAGAFTVPILALHIVRLLSSISTGDLETLYSSWLTIIAQYPPSNDQLQRWQLIADSLNITRLKFVV